MIHIVAVTPRVCIIFRIIRRSGDNYYAYTRVSTPQDIDQMIYFKGFVWFLYNNRYCELDCFFWISSNASVANSKMQF